MKFCTHNNSIIPPPPSKKVFFDQLNAVTPAPFLPSLSRYVSRYHVKDSARHVILGTQQFKPNEFASQINLSMENAWGILRCVIDICRKLDEGKYLILKDPNKVSYHPALLSGRTLVCAKSLLFRDMFQ